MEKSVTRKILKGLELFENLPNLKIIEVLGKNFYLILDEGDEIEVTVWSVEKRHEYNSWTLSVSIKSENTENLLKRFTLAYNTQEKEAEIYLPNKNYQELTFFT
ncbi:TPA: hypothetical protein DCX66_03615 [Candidatus Nomurabacteria bacterium]|uniref:Uncharacterized protein n=1 Tax=Candidatus Nomurabacteria bacterium GW2011_GWE1_35_16 TaxID=1618761 RepID=A0A0G0BT62_9BACT|nr:MAG: hypothetical protein UR55_C0001G0025 [Candidatus Nomurabacteria bacterium GW2011_GWF1_34_20]KKP63734.1 MAG: hypothetical protein UR57_C0001G0025 [Candidatus Nomurabacteria bacterium GW2011_GWE2_34_25]KKP66946.1 MAG: hypothetical protein UR64_C0001G0025 [Candidatus Nomurabacteria bacterium GW2011_GWE1_35_16]HAE36770.1 hypothetical protein [Candidatus Nomurabacteria bacterium]HAX65527.1 hypothetical protein [Candidatus Nomurabacteria bacterium]